MSHFTIVPAIKFTGILRIQNTNEKGKVMSGLTAIKGIGKKKETLIWKLIKDYADVKAQRHN